MQTSFLVDLDISARKSATVAGQVEIRYGRGQVSLLLFFREKNFPGSRRLKTQLRWRFQSPAQFVLRKLSGSREKPVNRIRF